VSVVADVLQEGDIARLAHMHVAALPESLVSLLGEPYARAFYCHCASASEELLLVERERGELSGACLVSLAPETLSRRLWTRTPLLLFAPLAIRRLPLRAMLLGAARPAAPQQAARSRRTSGDLRLPARRCGARRANSGMQQEEPRRP